MQEIPRTVSRILHVPYDPALPYFTQTRWHITYYEQLGSTHALR